MVFSAEKLSFFPEGFSVDALQMAIHMAVLRENSREQERQETISWLAFLMVILINIPPYALTQCGEPFLKVIVSAEGATLGMSICC